MNTPYALDVTGKLAACGMSPTQIHEWWRTPHPELDDRPPRDAIYRNGRRVLEQAERDAAGVLETNRRGATT